MKKIILLLFLFIGLQSFAQENRRTFMVMYEYRVKDQDIWKKNQPVRGEFFKKANEGVITYRLAYSSESGTIYVSYIIEGDANLGKFTANRNENSNKFMAANPKVVQEDKDNLDGPVRVSTWLVVNQLRFLPKDYNPADFTFRKMIFRAVSSDQEEAFEKKLTMLNEQDDKLGIKYNSITYKAVDGYPTNTYLTFVPDNSLLDYYKHYTDRSEKRNASKESTELSKGKPNATAIRFDHLKLNK